MPLEIDMKHTFSELCAIRDGLELLLKGRKTLAGRQRAETAEVALGKVKAELAKHVQAIKI